MKPLKKLASQTVVYGLSSILGRFLNYLLVPLYTYAFAATAYGVVSEFYAYAGFFAVFLGLGLETAFFRFRTREGLKEPEAYGAALIILIPANLIFLGLVMGYRETLAEWLRYPDHPEYLVWFSAILAMDAICSLPFARLRAEERAIRFASIKLTEIFLTIGLNVLFIVGFPLLRVRWPDPLWDRILNPEIGVGAIFLANLMGSACKALLLVPEFRRIDFAGGLRWIRPMLVYALPMVVIGFAGMINEMLDRAVMKYWLPYDLATNLRMLGIYGACYKLSILMTLFVQAFRYAGEPFFFSISGKSDAKQAYATVMRYFVVFCSLIYLVVVLFIDIFQYFIGEEYREGLAVVPILLMANLWLGIYVNLSIWYKLTDRTGLGAWVSLLGAALTVALNIAWIPKYGYLGAAWATLACYGAMAGVSWLLGQIFFPVPYPAFRILSYLILCVGVTRLQPYLVTEAHLGSLVSGALLLAGYLIVIAGFEVWPLLRRHRGVAPMADTAKS
jgi:O-antigen/teichoic acid export membrane protein